MDNSETRIGWHGLYWSGFRDKWPAHMNTAINRRVPQKFWEFLNLLKNCLLVTKDSAPWSLSFPTFALRVVQNMKRGTGGLRVHIPTRTSGVNRCVERTVCMPSWYNYRWQFRGVFQEYRAPILSHKRGKGWGTHTHTHTHTHTARRSCFPSVNQPTNQRSYSTQRLEQKLYEDVS